ncbi:hypothetical protein T08_15396 [Trichinella sp. T8]|nr:hypothetical protein T08_15396 [Trichinella sp. T8]
MFLLSTELQCVNYKYAEDPSSTSKNTFYQLATLNYKTCRSPLFQDSGKLKDRIGICGTST